MFQLLFEPLSLQVHSLHTPSDPCSFNLSLHPYFLTVHLTLSQLSIDVTVYFNIGTHGNCPQASVGEVLNVLRMVDANISETIEGRFNSTEYRMYLHGVDLNIVLDTSLVKSMDHESDVDHQPKHTLGSD